LAARIVVWLFTAMFAGLTALALYAGSAPDAAALPESNPNVAYAQAVPPATPWSPAVDALADERAATPADPATTAVRAGTAPTPTPTPTRTLPPLPATPRPRVLRPVPQEAAPVTRTGPVSGSIGPRRGRRSPDQPPAVIVLDPGHGRGDPGAVHRTASGTVDLMEEEVNRAVAAHLKEDLERMGYQVYLTRQGVGAAAPRPLAHAFIVADQIARVRLAMSVEADLFVSIHANGSPLASHEGTEVWYCGQSPHGRQNAALAALLLQGMINGYRTYGYEPANRGLHEDAETRTDGVWCPIIVTREAPAPSALVELLFMTNDADARVLADDRARRDVAMGLARAIDQYLADHPPSR